MKSRSYFSIAGVVLLSGLLLSTSASGQQPRYRLVDLGTFGGPASYFANGFDGILNDHGVAVGGANTSTPNPFCFPAPNCFAEHAFLAQNGSLTDLGVLDGGNGSLAGWISANGLIAGLSQNGEIDPFIPGFPEVRGVLWRNGKIIDLGTLPEGGFESSANAVNNRGQVVGIALNTIDDSCSFFGVTQARAFLWQHGAMQDLGTLGGPDADAELINDAGQIAGISYTDSINPATGCPSLHTFFWQNGTMSDVGTFGGTSTEVTALNQRGEVVGISNLTGDQTFHPFLWNKGQLTDLGTLGGDTGAVNWINDRGEIVGKADLPGQAPQLHDAVLWKGGQEIDLGVLPGDSCSNAYFVNSRGQIVGASEAPELCTLPEPVGQHAFLRDPGGPMTNLNTLIPAGATLDLTYAVAINDRGEIAGFGIPVGCAPQDVGQCGHAYMLIPCGAGEVCVNTSLSTGPDLSFPSALDSTTTRSQSLPVNPVHGFKTRKGKFHLPGQGR